jgi:hypothetical protein
VESAAFERSSAVGNTAVFVETASFTPAMTVESGDSHERLVTNQGSIADDDDDAEEMMDGPFE